MQEKHQLIPLSWRQGGKESDKNNISHGNTLAQLVLGIPCNLLGKQVSEEEMLVSKVRHTDLRRQISRQTLKLCTGKQPMSYLGLEMRKQIQLTHVLLKCAF